MSDKTARVDIWRDTPVRLLGYANEVGESFRHIFPRMVMPSYAVAFAYTFADVADKGYLQYEKDDYKVTSTCFIQAGDALVW